MCTSYGLNTNWDTKEFAFGTADTFFYEDNVVSNVFTAHDSGVGGRWCSRHNTYTYSGSNAQFPFADAHGNQPNGNSGLMGVEIYENAHTVNGGKTCLFFAQRGGKALVYNNTTTTTGSLTLRAREEYNDNEGYGSATTADGQPQHVSSSYYWNNKKNTSLYSLTDYMADVTVDYGGTVGVVPQWNVDCWRHTTPFTGESGVGVGLLADRPASGLTVGVGYWATDESKLYRATDATTWEEFYAPYTYPHPLRNTP
jgi:hypothetical protein